jgi:hypothetical protein
MVEDKVKNATIIKASCAFLPKVQVRLNLEQGIVVLMSVFMVVFMGVCSVKTFGY